MRALLAAALLVSFAGPALAGAPVALRAVLTSHGPEVTLADLFDGVTGPAAQVKLGAAPLPGRDAVLDAGQVQLIAKSAGLDWSNPQGVRRILVTSGGAGAAGPVPAAPVRHPQALAYARNLAVGEIVRAADLIWSDEVIAGPNAPGDPDQLIGEAAVRPLRGGSAVQAGDLAPAAIIHHDETIDVAFESGGIRLVLQGKALKDAALGQTVQVLNPQSKKVIEAVASAPGKAVVGPRADVLKAAPFATASLR